MNQLQRVLKIIDEEEQLTSLLNYKLIRDSFITEHAEEKYNLKTIKSHIMSIRHFYPYLVADEPASISFEKGTILMLHERLQRWTKSYKKECRKQEWKKKRQGRKGLVTSCTVTVQKEQSGKRYHCAILALIWCLFKRDYAGCFYPGKRLDCRNNN